MNSKHKLLFGAMLVVLLLAICSAPAQNLSFTAATYPRGNNGTSVFAVTDVNGDGKLDVVCANFGSLHSPARSLTVLTNDGSGLLGFNATLSVTNGAEFVLAADVNGDGKPDLIVSYQNSTLLTVLTNNGSGVFGFNASISLGTNDANFIMATDVNGDGKLDLVTVNTFQNTMSVLTNDGAGIFGYSATLNVGNFPGGATVADINGDGKPDLICANSEDDTLTVFTNHGSGFGFSATLPVGSAPGSVAALDVNGSGRIDLISANNGDSTLTLLTNNGSGSFGSNATYQVGVGPESIAVADVNGDGKPDLITANDNRCPGNYPCDNGTLTVLTNNGGGGFGFNTTLTAGWWPGFVAAADLNGDGKPDLIASNLGQASGGVLYNNALSVFLNTTVFPNPSLKIKTSGKGVTIMWPAAAVSFALQTNAVLDSTNWSGYQGSISDDGINKSVTNIPSTVGNLFFRLKQ